MHGIQLQHSTTMLFTTSDVRTYHTSIKLGVDAIWNHALRHITALISMRPSPSHEDLQGNYLTLVHWEAHKDEAVHCLSAIGVHVLPIIEEKFVNPWERAGKSGGWLWVTKGQGRWTHKRLLIECYVSLLGFQYGSNGGFVAMWSFVLNFQLPCSHPIQDLENGNWRVLWWSS